MDRIVVVFLLLLQGSFVWCQNPFDIKSRKNTDAIKTEESPKSVIEKHEEASKSIESATKPITIIEPPKLAPKENIEEEEIVKTPDIIENPVRKKSGNPFNVSHVPISKEHSKTKNKPKTKTKTKPRENKPPPKISEEKTAILPSASNVRSEVRIETKKKFLERNLPIMFLFISLLILTFIVGFTRKTITNVIRSTYNENFMKLINKQTNNGTSPAFMLLYAMFFINVALLIFLYARDKVLIHPGILFLYIILGLLGVYIIRHVFLFALGAVFSEVRKETSEYSFTIQVFNICIGLILLPINFIIAYGSEFLMNFSFKAAIIILGIFYIIRTIRAILLSSRHLIRNKFHYFLYLCTSEIGPIFLLIKLLRETISN